MRKRRWGLGHVGALAILVSIFGCTAAVPSNNADTAPLKKVADVPLPDPAVRFDYQSLDGSHGRLYIAHMNADQLVVFDTKKREVVANLDGFPNVHGVWAVPELGRVYASATGEHKIAVVDMQTLKSTETRMRSSTRRPTLSWLPSLSTAVLAIQFMTLALATSSLRSMRRTN